MILDLIKGVVLAVFSLFLGALGLVAEVLCVPRSRIGSNPIAFDFIEELWRESYKDYN